MRDTHDITQTVPRFPRVLKREIGSTINYVESITYNGVPPFFHFFRNHPSDSSAGFRNFRLIGTHFRSPFANARVSVTMSSMCNKTFLKSMRLINVSRSLDRRKMSVMNNNENSHLYDVRNENACTIPRKMSRPYVDEIISLQIIM